MLLKDRALQDADPTGSGICVYVMMESDYPVYRGRIHQNDEEELAIACMDLRFFSLQRGGSALSAPSYLAADAFSSSAWWYGVFGSLTRRRAPSFVCEPGYTVDVCGRKTSKIELVILPFQKLFGTRQQRNRILVPRNFSSDRKTCKVPVPVSMAVAWGFRDGISPRGSQWAVKVDAWEKAQDTARIIVKGINVGKYDNVWLDLEEYRVSALNTFPISGFFANDSYPRPSSLHPS